MRRTRGNTPEFLVDTALVGLLTLGLAGCAPKAYRVRIRSTVTGPNFTYNALLQTAPDGWRLVYIPYARLVPSWRGYRMDVNALDPVTIGAFGFMLSDKQPDDFALSWSGFVR